MRRSGVRRANRRKKRDLIRRPVPPLGWGPALDAYFGVLLGVLDSSDAITEQLNTMRVLFTREMDIISGRNDTQQP